MHDKPGLFISDYLGRNSPVPELSFLPAPLRDWTRASEKRVSLFARPGSSPIGGGKKREFRDWTRVVYGCQADYENLKIASKQNTISQISRGWDKILWTLTLDCGLSRFCNSIASRLPFSSREWYRAHSLPSRGIKGEGETVWNIEVLL